MMDAHVCTVGAIGSDASPDSLASIEGQLALLDSADLDTALMQSGLTNRLKKRLAERMLEGEIQHHLMMRPLAAIANHRNGSTPKTVSTPSGDIEVDIPRLRYATFVPSLIPRYQRRLPGLDDRVFAMYANGTGMRDTLAHVSSLYAPGTDPELIATVGDAVLADVRQWQSRPLKPAYSAIHAGTLLLQPPASNDRRNRRVHVLLGLGVNARRTLLGLWLENPGDDAFWGKVTRDLRNRGLAKVDAVIAPPCLPGFRDAMSTAFPAARMDAAVRP